MMHGGESTTVYADRCAKHYFTLLRILYIRFSLFGFLTMTFESDLLKILI